MNGKENEDFIGEYFDVAAVGLSLVDGDILPMGALLGYVSSSFLNGFVNYVKPLKAYVSGRYCTWDSKTDWIVHGIEMTVQNPPYSFNWTKVKVKTKSEAFDLLTTQGNIFHPRFSDFRDDLLLLARVETEGVYWFFHFDMDCSDCYIGRFRTEDFLETVVASFDKYALEIDNVFNPYGARQVPLSYFESGWLRS